MTQNAGLAKSRGKARRLAMQAIYQWQMTSDPIDGIIAQFDEEADKSSLDKEYFTELVQGVYDNLKTIDDALAPHMDRAVESVDPVERAIIRLACYEFSKRLDVPYKVVINEAVTLTKKFSTEQSHTFVNAVLDKVAHQIRTSETGAQ